MGYCCKMSKNSMSFYQNTFRLFWTGISLIFLMPVTYSQTIRDFSDQWPVEKNQYASDGQEDAHYLEASFNAFARKIDDEFSDYLTKDWNDYIISPGNEYEHPKPPANQPIFKLSDLPAIPPPRSLPYFDQDGDEFSGRNKWTAPRVRKPESDDFNKGTVSFRFYGNEINLSFDKLLLATEVKTASKESAVAFWQQFIRSNNNHLIDQLMDYRDLLGLNDWGYFCLLKETARHLYIGNKWADDLLGWALALHSGYQVRLGYDRSGSTILFPCVNNIYLRQFILIDQTRYYLDTELKSDILVTYGNNLSSATRIIDLSFYKSLNFRSSRVEHKRVFTWNDKHFEFNFNYNPQTLRFYTDYPVTDASIYFDSPVSSGLKEGLYSQFLPIISKMNKAEASALLQQFVQEAFEFQPVNLPNGKDRFLFPEEICALNAFNDKGRAVLYSWLIQNLVKLPVIGLEFPGFFSTAVCFDQPIDGDHYLWQGKKYTIVDPTFRNAPVGISVSKSKPKIINLRNSYGESETEKHVWSVAISMAASRGGNYSDIVYDSSGRSFITGYFGGALNTNPTLPFIACFSEKHSLQWLRKFEGSGSAYGFTVENINDDEIYMAGSFSGELKFGKSVIHSSINRPDLFFVKFDHTGELIWMKKTGVDSLEIDANLAYLVKFDRSGDNFFSSLINEDERNIKTGFSINNDNWIYFSGSRNGTTGMKRTSSNRMSETTTGISAEIKKEHSRLISEKCNPAVAGIAAILHLLENPGVEIRGSLLMSLLNQYNPSFRSLNSQLYNALAQIDLIRNENGNISIRTIGQKSINLSGIKMTSNALIKLDHFGNGDISIGIISGFEAGNGGNLIPLNNILVDVSSGNLIFDYDSDHTLRTIDLNRLLVKK